MKAVILVGGKATRLLPLTCNVPKALVPVVNRPFLEHVIRHLSHHQIREIVLAQGHLAKPIEDYFGDGSQFGVKLKYVSEDRPRGTAGGIKNAENYLDETFLALNGDVFTNLDITAMVNLHQERKAKVTIALARVDDPTSYGLIETDATGRVTRFLEKPKPSEITTDMINAGSYILEPDILKQIAPQTEVSLEREVFPRLLAQGKPVYAFTSSGYWIDIGTPEKYLQLHQDLLSGKCQQHSLTSISEVRVEEPGAIHPTVQIEGPVIIGARCSLGRHVKLSGGVVIGDGTSIMEDSAVEGSIIWRNARLEPHVHLKNSILADNCYLKEGSSCEGSVLGDNVTVGRGGKLKPGSKIWPGTTVA